MRSAAFGRVLEACPCLYSQVDVTVSAQVRFGHRYARRLGTAFNRIAGKEHSKFEQTVRWCSSSR